MNATFLRMPPLIGPVLMILSLCAGTVGAEERFLLDMVHDNPGEAKTESLFRDPKELAGRGYNGKVPINFIEAAVTFDSFDPETFPEGSAERKWVEKLAESIDREIEAAHAAGIKIYPFADFIVLPKSLVAKYGGQMLAPNGKVPDVHKPHTQKVLRALIDEIFTRFPTLDGLMVRWGETYLVDIPHHTGGNPIIRGVDSQVALINLLREEVCVKRGRQLFYRTWGKDFHYIPEYYLKVTDSIEPHPKLVFSIKYPIVDFQRMQIFNPTLGIGKHRQLVEVCCQQDSYGKGAHPYYIGQGVIDGWEELRYLDDPAIRRHFYGFSDGQIKERHNCLRDLMEHPNFAGVWTWSRGGGWQGPYIKNELWCALNAYVIAQWAQDPSRSEEDICKQFARDTLGLNGIDRDRFYQICLLSAAGTLRGRCSYYARNNVWWTRDDVMGGIEQQAGGMFDNVVREGATEKMIAEKAQAVAIWRQIEALSRQFEVSDPDMKEFLITSCTYGRIKFEIFEKGWTVMLLGTLGDKTGDYDRDRIAQAIADYDRLWNQWRALKESSPSCATLYHNNYCRYIRGIKMEYSDTGLDSSINKYRKIVSMEASE